MMSLKTADKKSKRSASMGRFRNASKRQFKIASGIGSLKRTVVLQLEEEIVNDELCMQNNELRVYNNRT